MATLQTGNHTPAFNVKARLKSITHDRDARKSVPISAPPEKPKPQASAASPLRPHQDGLSELEQRQLMLQTVALYNGWSLVSIQHRPENEVLVAYLVRSSDHDDALVAIREGRAMQIIMDSTGDFRIQRPRRRQETVLARLLHKLASLLGLVREVPAATR